MKGRGTLLLTCVAGTIIIGADFVMKRAPHQAENGCAEDPWWVHGEVEVGGRFFVNNPQRDGLNYQSQKSLAKYYEYSSIKPGPFSNVWLSIGSKDGLYQIDLGGKNIGYTISIIISMRRKPASIISISNGTRLRTSTAPARRRFTMASAATI